MLDTLYPLSLLLSTLLRYLFLPALLGKDGQKREGKKTKMKFL